MGRPKRAATGGTVYHVLNRANARLPIFKKDADFAAFEKILGEAQDRIEIRILAYCLMPNHWHLVLWPYKDGDLSDFTGWLTLTHTQRWHAHHGTAGTGHLYQGRFKSFPIQDDDHFLTVCRYVERNPLRAGLVERAEDWQWSSLWSHLHTSRAQTLLSPWPVRRSPDWAEHVNAAQTEGELEAIRRCIKRGSPFGDQDWTKQTAIRLGLESTLKPRGRPQKNQVKGA